MPLNPSMSNFSFFFTQVKVADRNAVVTANAETEVVQPVGLQKLIDTETGKQVIHTIFIFVIFSTKQA